MTIFMGLFDHFPKKGCTPRRRVLPYSEQYQLKTEEPQEITLIPLWLLDLENYGVSGSAGQKIIWKF